ncbi:TonB-dependent receptor [Pedobacter sp. BS3]|uniref:TonB-dependent receptor n=1 Tax=Pedobacter sp. BS3 TaxID=2567937 RepID=UPI0011EBCA58|nr:TonB-dependent receptor [Pedobacter sp. BS3]TZF82819.1 TonB-dependent receptor [Pedobacter sp. BS3]
MKLTTVLLTIACMQVSAVAVSQKISITKNNASLESVFKDIRKQSGYLFLYNDELLEHAKPVSISVKQVSLDEALKACFVGQPFTYNLVEKTIVVTPLAKEIEKEVRKEITGTVRDSIDVLPGVSVKVKGTNLGTMTDANGKYKLAVPDDATLVFSMVGYATQEIPVAGKTVIDVLLKAVGKNLEEVVVVAFGKQKRSDMVGSVTSVNPSDLKVPSSNLTTALAGRAAGVIAFQRSGEPGQDNADFFIRGVTTFGYKKDPLILIDGIEVTTTDLARIQVDDITNFSILKDATATALYGSRAANGVILVTTKEGTVGKPHIAFRIENSISQPVTNVELADPVTYMKLYNEATLTRDPLAPLVYSDRKIENTMAGNNPVVYPANDWRKLMFKDRTMNQRANLSVSGGGNVARYYVSGSFNKDNGLMKVDHRNNFNNNIDLKSYTLRSNVNINLSKLTQMTVRLSGNFDDYQGPIDGGEAMYKKVMRSNPVLFPAYYPVDAQHATVSHIMFGNYDDGSYINPYADMTKGYKEYSRSLMLAQLELNQDLKFITKGLAFSAMVNTNRRSYFDVVRNYKPFWYTLAGYDVFTDMYSISNINPDSGTEYLGYSEGPTTVSSAFYLESRLNYNREFGKHGLSGMLVFMGQTQLNANAGNLQKSLPHRNLGISGRATYDYDKRYYGEFNFGYNGSERFDKNHRFGFFPSVGAAWTISNEKFFKELKPTISNLRLRATYGIIGNDAIGSDDDRFFYLSNVNMNSGDRGASFGRDPGAMYTQNGVAISRYANSNITWETSAQKNLALEVGLFDKLNINAEYFYQNRKNILMTRGSIPLEAGFTAPIMANVGQATGKGVDISLDYKEYFQNSLWLSALGNFTYATSKYKVYEEPRYAEAYRYHVGNAIYQNYGYIAEQLFVDDDEVLNSPRQNFGPYGAGDIKYRDVNRDGQITDADQVPIGNPTMPEIVYGFGISSGYKGFDFSVFFQGLANESFWIDAEATSPFAGDNQLLKAYADSHWSEDVRDEYALWPRLSTTVSANNSQPSTWFMRNGSFLRLKQVEFGYTLPKKLQKRINTSTFRIYVNASNLLTFSKFGLWDVEMGGKGLGYPIQKVFNIGLNIAVN